MVTAGQSVQSVTQRSNKNLSLSRVRGWEDFGGLKNFALLARVLGGRKMVSPTLFDTRERFGISVLCFAGA